MTPEQAYDEIARIAQKHALILTAYAGVITIVHPDTQKDHGVFEHIQHVHGLGEHPQTLADRRAEINVLDAVLAEEA